MEIKWICAAAAVIAGVFGGLYVIGKRTQKNGTDASKASKIKVSGRDIEDLEQKLKNKADKKNKVKFEFIEVFGYENLVEWINKADLKDINEGETNYGCLIVRSSSDLEQFNLDLSSLSEYQKSHVFGAMIINTGDKSILSSRWIVYDTLDQDLMDVFGDDNIKILK